MKIYRFKSLPSTNDYMKENIHLFNEYDVVQADIQTAGKARRGNVWVSQEGMALFTFLVKKSENFPADDQEYLKLPLIAGLSVIKGLKRTCELDYKFKWTNDVYLHGRKLTGILVEKSGDCFLIGIGINVNNTLPEQLEDTAISLSRATRILHDLDGIITDVIEEFKCLFARFTGGMWDKILEEINSLSYLKGRKIHLKINRAFFTGIAQDIDTNGELEVLIDGNIRRFSIGEVFEERIRIE